MNNTWEAEDDYKVYYIRIEKNQVVIADNQKNAPPQAQTAGFMSFEKFVSEYSSIVKKIWGQEELSKMILLINKYRHTT